MKQELIQLPNGEEITRDEWMERESYVSSKPNSLLKERLRYLGFNVLGIAAVVIVALICPKCSDADDRALGTDQQPTHTQP